MQHFDHKISITKILNSNEDYPEEKFSGRGIVIPAGGEKYYIPAWVEINLLRYLGCTLPIEVWYYGDAEMPDNVKDIFRGLQGVSLVDAEQVSKEYPARILKGWPIKPYSIIHSSFKEVLFLDADNVPVRDPEYLFDSDFYKDYGCMFWPDSEMGFLGSTLSLMNSEIWLILNLDRTDQKAFESGQIVIDKSRCWRSLKLTMYFNSYSDYYYKYVYGDKDTFLMAWLLTKQPFRLMPPMLNGQGVMYQKDHLGEILFQHRWQPKWNFDGNPTKEPEGFIHERKCLTFLNELRKLL